MNTCKQIQASFWQNAFVLDLTPEERYFYVYLITNTMTTACGIYRFNMKLAVLETGLGEEVIYNYLDSFQSSGKIVVSKMSREIMIVNWLKHNSKKNKKIISRINSELKEVKDKELLRQFYEICKVRQYPVEEIFNGVALTKEDKLQPENSVQAVQKTARTQEKEAATSETKTEEGKETQELIFTTIKPASTGKRRRKIKEEPYEKIEVYESCGGEDDQEQAVKGTPVMNWSFNDSGGVLGNTG